MMYNKYIFDVHVISSKDLNVCTCSWLIIRVSVVLRRTVVKVLVEIDVSTTSVRFTLTNLTLTLKITSTQFVEMQVLTNNNPSLDYTKQNNQINNKH